MFQKLDQVLDLWSFILIKQQVINFSFDAEFSYFSAKIMCSDEHMTRRVSSRRNILKQFQRTSSFNLFLFFDRQSQYFL
jgi:hypothetical protein